MNVQSRTTALYCTTLAGLLMLSACGKNEQAASPTPAAPAATAPAPAAPTPAATTPTPAATTPAPANTTPAPASTSGKSASIQPANDIKVAAVTLGSAVDASHIISKVQRRFAPTDKAIYASVTTLGSTDRASLSANWSYVDGKDQPFSSTTESVATDGPATTTFKVQNPNAWPVGQYKVVISLNGKAVASENFEVRS
ncbi:hypothetical protein [Dyella humicola]|uniref:hypothetical protein n=1 Tax=Dyella humicola TaxID=2992126 RepID=UPI00225C1BA2|nr:hypothetical protein [Dyella humicola]